MEHLETERQFYNEQNYPPPQGLENYHKNRQSKQIFISSEDKYQKILHLPIYLSGYMSELIKVNLEQTEIIGKFTIFATVKTNINIDTIRELQIQSKEAQSDEQKLQRLSEFINNNLILECGNKLIDIINSKQAVEQKDISSQEESQGEQEEQDDDEEQDDYVYKEIHSLKKQFVSYQIQSYLKCQFELNSAYFPYFTLDSSLIIRARSQYFDNITIKYHMIEFPPPNDYSLEQFTFKFINPMHEELGIFRVNCSNDSYSFKAINKDRIKHLTDQEIRESAKRLSGKQKVISEEIYEVTRYFEFKFEVFSYNIPFILRNIVPQLLLCFLSLMCYFGNAESIWDVYGNVILLMITLIQLLSNFRTSEYDNSTFNLFQINLLGIIIMNVFLTIVGTGNYYSQDSGVTNINSQTALFWISVSIGVFFVASNAIILSYFGIKSKSYSYKANQQQKKTYTRLCIWNEELFDNIVDDMQTISQARQSFRHLDQP